MIEVSHLCKSFNGVQILSDVSAIFEEGKINFTIGKSGSGKTVLLKSIIGLHEIDSGNIYFHDRNFTTMTINQRKEIRKEIGMVFQGSALFDSSTLEENVMFPLKMFSDLSYDECRERANFCLQRVDVVGKNHLFPSEISGGMQKRVAIARAIALNPKYLFCDEPNSGLDPQTSILIDNLIKEIVREYNMTTIINTHDMNSVMEIADKIIFIHEGKLWWQGDKESIWTTDNPEVNRFIFASELTKKIRVLYEK
ncbi:MAG: ATP-binding cassette domain-containing protein [Bacteroidales bacterium]|jgi:phospholipid/cholesterol/gamma-HCH transport system ATP-binding protein|nr:ATP-binding cassette domain-containing protein [Bacteroidales bacterium]